MRSLHARRAARPLLLALSLAASACGGHPWSGEEGKPIDATVFQGVLLVHADVDGKSGPPLIADSGSPVVALSPEGYGVPAGVSTIDGLDVGALTFDGIQVIGGDLIESPDPATPIGGILGCTVLCELAATFNYRDQQFVLGGAPAPGGVEGSIDVPFRLEGGGEGGVLGVGGVVTFPPSRVLVSAEVEGRALTMLVDTGASIVYLRGGTYAELAADGRGQLDASVESIQGTSTLETMRLRDVTVGGATVQGAPASTAPALEDLLDSVASETGTRIDGLIGGTFLREFLVTIDYPATTLRLARYATRDHIVDDFDRVGVLLAPPDASQRVLVSQVIPGTDADAKGVVAGDEVVSIDGAPVGSLDAVRSNALLLGAVGAKRKLTFGAASSPALDHQTVDVAIDDLLPLP